MGSLSKADPRKAYFGYCPHTVTVYNKATIKVLIYLYYEYCPTVTEWGQYPRHANLVVPNSPTYSLRFPKDPWYPPGLNFLP